MTAPYRNQTGYSLHRQIQYQRIPFPMMNTQSMPIMTPYNVQQYAERSGNILFKKT